MQIPAIDRTQFAEQSQPEKTDDCKSNSDVATPNCPFILCDKEGCQTPWHKPCVYPTSRAVTRMHPVVVGIGVSEVFIATVLTVIVIFYRFEYDRMYGTEDTRIISRSAFAGLMTLAVTGVLLLLSLYLHKQQMLLIRILISMLLGGYIFIFSVLKIHFALRAIEKDPSGFFTEQNKFLLSTACSLGIVTLVASVAHFTSNVTVFTYYNLRYIHPVMFNRST